LIILKEILLPTNTSSVAAAISNTTDKKIKIAINNQIIDKVDSSNKSQCSILTTEFENQELTIEQFAEQINLGHPFCAQHNGRRSQVNFICSNVLAVDIDEGMLVSEAREQPFVRDHAAILYTTPSHTPENQRFRIVFVLEQAITDAAQMRLAHQGLIRKFGGDKSCKDACRIFYGSKGSSPIVLGNVLQAQELNHLIELGSEPTSIPDHGNAGSGRPVATRRSEKALDLDQPVRLRSGAIMPLRDVPLKTQIHCPIHVDHKPSAFVLESKDHIRGVYCSGCAATFWPAPNTSHPIKDFDFYKVEDIIATNDYQDTPNDSFDDVPTNIARSSRMLNERYLPDLPFGEGITFVRSPKGSGKTEWLKKVVKRCREENKSVLLVGHRKTLIQSMAERLGLTCYFYSDGNQTKNRFPTNYYAVSVDSISKLLDPIDDKYDVIIIDESEQVFSHLTSSTVKDKRRACYMMLFHYLSAAKSVIVADADLGAITIEGLSQSVNKESTYDFYLNTYAAERCDYQNYINDTHLLQDMLDAVRAGGRHYVATNSITRAEELQEAIRLEFGNTPKIMLVTSKVSDSAEVQAFINNIKTEILKYDVVIASPSLGTGIDITFDNDAQYIDTVFGFFGARVNTHFDIDQQISRVRNPKSIKVWVSPEQFTFETEPAVIRREAMKNGTLNDILIGYERDSGEAKLDETYLGVYAHVISISRASKNMLRKNLLNLRVRNGWNVLNVDTDVDQAETGKEVKAIAKATVKRMRIEDICAAPKIDEDVYDKLNGKNYQPSTAEQIAMRRYEAEKFYLEDVSVKLLLLDDNGAYRKKIRLLATYLSHESDLANSDKKLFELNSIVTDAEKSALKQKLLRSLLISAGLSDVNHSIKLDEIIQSENLSNFIQECKKHDLQLQDIFGISLRGDLEAKPVSQLGKILELIGLSLEEAADPKKVNGKKIRFYRVSEYAWELARGYSKKRVARLNIKSDVFGY
jgi:hypothetical protein